MYCVMLCYVHQFFEDAVTNDYMIAVVIDDFHNIHSHHRPSSPSQTQVCHMTTLLVKNFQQCLPSNHLALLIRIHYQQI